MGFLLLGVLGVLLFASFMDIKYKAMPSVVLTSTLFAVLLLRHENFMFGLYALVFALVIRDMIDDVAGLEFGMADIKILVIIGLLIGNMGSFLSMLVIFIVLQFAYTLVWRINISQKDVEMPFVPCLLAVYLAMMLVGGVA